MAASDMIPKDASISEQNTISKDIDILHAMTDNPVSAVKCRIMRESSLFSSYVWNNVIDS